MFPFDRCVHLFPPSLQWVPWPLLAEPCGSPPSSVLWVRKTARPPVRVRLWSPLAIALPLLRAGMASSPGFLGNPFGNMPRASDSGDFGPPFAIAVVPDTAFRHFNDVGIATIVISELNLHGLLPCCVRFAPNSVPANGNTRYRPAR